jgi:hypothetical protein
VRFSARLRHTLRLVGRLVKANSMAFACGTSGPAPGPPASLVSHQRAGDRDVLSFLEGSRIEKSLPPKLAFCDSSRVPPSSPALRSRVGRARKSGTGDSMRAAIGFRTPILSAFSTAGG